MNINHLLKHSKSYELLRKYTAFCFSLFYKEIVIINKNNVPESGPVIFAPNHQNALMDALAIICTSGKQPVFMARADIFKKRMIASILHFLKIIPVYRIRDGKEELANNEESFRVAKEVLINRQYVGIMPEGNHGSQRRLRPLKKGIARLALEVQSTIGKSIPVKIIPVGIEYSHYVNFRSEILVIYGQPIEVSDFLDDYTRNQTKAINLLRERLAAEMKVYMLNIDSDGYYSLISKLIILYVNTLKKKLEAGDSFYDKFQVEKIISDRLISISTTSKDQLEQLLPLVNEYETIKKKLRLNDEVLEPGTRFSKSYYFDIIRYAFFLVFAVSGAILNFIPAVIIKYLSSNVKDLQFQSSFKFALGLLILPLYYLTMLALHIPVFTKVIIIFSMPVLGVLSFDYTKSLIRFCYRLRYDKLKKDNNLELIRIIGLRGQIIRILETII
jgi:1-acyl-sn-glycerol-3-phosphate acyltransferase